MSLFAGAGPRLFAVPPGADFAAAFARGLRARAGATPPEAMARIEIMVNTRRGLRAIEDALAAPGGPALLPRLALLAELGEDPLACPDLPPAIDPMRRRLRLARLVEAYLAGAQKAPPDAPPSAPPSAAPELAEALGGLMDELEEEGVAPEALDGLVAGELPERAAAHWQTTLGFIDIVRRAWPAIRAEEEGGALDPKARQRLVVERLVAGWAESPPAHPVIAAGSTGSVASTAELLAAIARLPQGAVVLPGFDPRVAPEIWQSIGPDHPLAPFRRLLALLGLAPADVRWWTAEPDRTPRRRLLTEALRPAPVTDAWQRAAPALAAEAEAATGGLTLIEAPTPRHEAAAIALAVRRALETPERRVALITPDAALARRVTAELGRFAVLPDDSLGRPLARTPPGVFLGLIAELAAKGAEPVRLAGLLQHPLTRPGMARREHLRLARRYELTVLRRKPEPGLAPGRLPAWPATPDTPPAGGPDWLARIEAALAPLAEALAHGSLAEAVAAHVAAAEALSRESEDAAPEVWQARAGEALARLMARLGRNADAHGDGPAGDYLALVANLLGREQLRPEAAAPHPRVAIWGTQEARIQGTDLAILGGLNEGVWPAGPGADPWLSRPMREALGLASPDLGIGLSAHDFLQGAARAEVILTRARKVEGAPTVASRWLVRLENLLAGVGGGAALAAMRARGEALVTLVDAVHRPAAPVERAPRPAPRPPAGARPRRLSVTQIERLVRDPYAIYARQVLRLEPLDPLGHPPDYLLRGSVVHEIVHAFVGRTEDGVPEGARAVRLFLEVAGEVLARQVPWPDMRRIWRGRLARAAPWFVDLERRRRAAADPAALETKGALAIELPGGPFTISARADRIDRYADGGGAVIDYKTGAPPTEKQVEKGFSHQLHLQAAMLMAGAFAEVGPLPPRGGAYVGLTGSGEGGRLVEMAITAEEARAHLDRVAALLAAFERAETPYLSWARPERESDSGDYDHLARRGEWEGSRDGDG